MNLSPIMETKFETIQPQIRSEVREPEEIGFGPFMSLLELPSSQAVELLVSEDFSPQDNSILSGSSSMKFDLVKHELLDSDSHPNSSSAVSDQSPKCFKRKETERKVEEPNKKSKKAVANEEGDEKLPYIHVRARRGQATDNHSLAERARREKINAKMKLLQELVPGCNKISGTAMVLDEIINHVQALQHQVEFLSMRLAAVNPSDLNFDAHLVARTELAVDNNSFPSMFTPSMWTEGQISGNGQQQYQPVCHFDGLHQPVWCREEENFVTQENSLLSLDSSAHSDILMAQRKLLLEFYCKCSSRNLKYTMNAVNETDNGCGVHSSVGAFSCTELPQEWGKNLNLCSLNAPG